MPQDKFRSPSMFGLATITILASPTPKHQTTSIRNLIREIKNGRVKTGGDTRMLLCYWDEFAFSALEKTQVFESGAPINEIKNSVQQNCKYFVMPKVIQTPQKGFHNFFYSHTF